MKIKITIIIIAIISFLIGFAIPEKEVAYVGGVIEPVEVCPVCTTSLVKSLRAEIEKHQLIVDAGFTEKDIENIIADKDNILLLIK